MNKYILVIDPVVSTRFLIESLKENGFKIMVILSREIQSHYHRCALDSCYSLYDKLIKSSGDINHDFNHIKNTLNQDDEIIFCLYGADYSTQYADQLAEQLIPNYSNNKNTSKLRCEKYKMIERLINDNISSPRQMLVDKDSTIDLSIFSLPIVVKPAYESAGSWDVKLCHSKTMTENHINTILNKKSLFEKTIDHVIVQEFITGTEYCANTVSFNGQHHVSSIFKYTKTIKNNEFVYRYVDFIHKNTSDHAIIESYMNKVLDSLGFEHGLAHTEVIVSDQTCKLIELNPRIAGFSGQMSIAEKMVTKSSQPEILSKLLTNKEMSIKSSNDCVRIYLLQSFDHLYNSVNIDKILDLSSYVSHKIINPSILETKKSITLTDVTAIIILKHSDIDAINKDTKTLMSLEESGEIFNIV